MLGVGRATPQGPPVVVGERRKTEVPQEAETPAASSSGPSPKAEDPEVVMGGVVDSTATPSAMADRVANSDLKRDPQLPNRRMPSSSCGDYG